MRLLLMIGRGVLCLLFAVGFSFAEQATVDELIRGLEHRYNSVQTLSTHFVEDYSIGGRARSPEAGVLTLRKKGKMRWDYSQPAGKLFVSDGKSLYLYTAADNRAEKIKLKDTEDMRAPLAFLLGHLDMKKDFRDFAEQKTAGGYWLKANAKSDRVPYEAIRMLIRPDFSIAQLEISTREESHLSFHFSNEKLNPVVRDAMFQFEAPPGAEVSDAVSLGSQEN